MKDMLMITSFGTLVMTLVESSSWLWWSWLSWLKILKAWREGSWVKSEIEVDIASHHRIPSLPKDGHKSSSGKDLVPLCGKGFALHLRRQRWTTIQRVVHDVALLVGVAVVATAISTAPSTTAAATAAAWPPSTSAGSERVPRHHFGGYILERPAVRIRIRELPRLAPVAGLSGSSGASASLLASLQQQQQQHLAKTNGPLGKFLQILFVVPIEMETNKIIWSFNFQKSLGELSFRAWVTADVGCSRGRGSRSVSVLSSDSAGRHWQLFHVWKSTV